MEISYNGTYLTESSNIEIKLEKTQQQPDIIISQNNNNYSSIIMYDPDAIGGIFVHWLILNIPKYNQITSGEIKKKYYPPSPPPGTGKHHYIFKLYTHDNKIEINNNDVHNYDTVSNILSKETNLIETLEFITEYSNMNGGRRKLKDRGRRKSGKKYIKKSKNIKIKNRLKKTRKIYRKRR